MSRWMNRSFLHHSRSILLVQNYKRTEILLSRFLVSNQKAKPLIMKCGLVLFFFFLLLGIATVTVVGQEASITDAPTTTTTEPACNGVVCTADQYCYQPDPANNATHQCLSLTYPCGGRTCANNNETFCSLNTNACMEYQNLCGGRGVVTDEQNCNDETRYSRWPLAGDLSSVSVATLCGLDCDGQPPEGDGTTEESRATRTVAMASSVLVVGSAWMLLW